MQQQQQQQQQGPKLPNVSALGAPHPVHKVEDLVHSILAQLDADGNADAACRAVASFCAADKAHAEFCASGGAPWRALVERVFRSTPIDRSLFLYGAWLKDRPKYAFTESCMDRALARIAAYDFLVTALPVLEKGLSDDWKLEVLDRDGYEVVRSELFVVEGHSAADIEEEFREEYPVTAKFAEWRMLAKERYDGCSQATRRVYEDQIRVTFSIGDDPLRGRLGWLGHEASGLGNFTQGLYPIVATEYRRRVFGKAAPTLTELWSKAHEDVHAMAERVGRGVVWAHHVGGLNRWSPNGKAICKYVLTGEPF